MKKLMTLTSLMLASFSAFAGIHTEHGTQRIVTDNFADKSSAYEASFDLINEIQDMSQTELRRELSIIGHGFARDIHLDNTYVTVEEYSEQRDEVKYRAIVNVFYNYRASDSGNN
ncbi:acyl-CoA synthetase [Vibrio owensii]|nr:acyl-CoA synthetase [Vibrio owensii]